MIDINELRQSAQAATPGPWYIGSGTYEGRNIYSAEAVTDDEGFTYNPVVATAEDDDVVCWEANARLIAAANPAVISELLDRLEAAEKSDAESLAMYRRARDERDALRAEIERLQSNLSASAQAFVQLEAVAAEARRNDATAMSWISEAKHAIGYEGDMPGFIGALRELNDVRRRVPAKITVSQAPHSQYAKGWNDCMKAIKEETK
jgi:hypothetical protein